MATFSLRSRPRICRRCCFKILHVVADAAHAELAEVREVFANLRSVQMELMRERLGRHGLHSVRVERVEAPQIDRQPIGGELGDLVAELLALDRQFHKDFIAVPAGIGTIEQSAHEAQPHRPFAAFGTRRIARIGVRSAQVAPRRAASPAALLAYPGFYQGQLVVVRGNLVTRDQPVLLSPSIERRFR